MNTPEQEELLIAAVTTAHRARTHEGIQPHANWFDLDDAGREKAFEETALVRAMEAALDPEGLSTTARAVLERIRGR